MYTETEWYFIDFHQNCFFRIKLQDPTFSIKIVRTKFIKLLKVQKNCIHTKTITMANTQNI